MRKTKKTLAILAIVAMVLAMIPVQVFAATTSAADSDRYAGADRIATALAVAANWTSADTVILAPADDANLVDALAAAPLAGQANAPILLTYKSGLNADVKAKIAALGAKKVYVIGAAANDAVVNAISGATVEKLAGADRWATADAINAKLTSPAGTFVVGYDAIPDALSAASYAAANKYAIVLTKVDGSVDASKLVGTKTYLVGGTGVVKDYAGATRLAGNDRYLTNEAVVKGLDYQYSKVYIANGESLVDALVAAPLAAQAKAAVLLANTSVAGASYVNGKLASTSKVIALGGTGVVSDALKGGVKYTAPAVLGVESVSAINLNQVKVVFNKAVDETTAENPSNYQLNTTALNANSNFELQSDDKTVIITLDTNDALAGNPAQSSEETLTVKNVLADGSFTEKISTTTKNVTFFDSTLPTVQSVTVTGNSRITVKFSEAVKNGAVDARYELNGSPLGAYSGTTSYKWSVNDSGVIYGDTVYIDFASPLPAGAYTLTINDGSSTLISDMAGFTVVKGDQTATVIDDTTAPKVVSVTGSTNGNVTVMFDKDIKVSQNFLLNGANSTLGVIDSSNKKKITIAFGTGVVKVGTNLLTVDKDIEDYYGNVLDEDNDYNVAFTAADDKVAPTVEGITVVDDSTIKVTFSELVSSLYGNNTGNYTIKNASGTKQTVSSATTANNSDNTKSIVTIVTASPLPNGTYTIEIANVQDQSENTMTTATLSFSASDSTDPTISGNALYTADNEIVVNFSEGMTVSGDASIADRTNFFYSTDGGTNYSVFPSTVEATVSNSNKTVTYKFANDKNVSTFTNVRVIGVKDAADNSLSGAVANVAVSAATGTSFTVNNTSTDYPKSYMSSSSKLTVEFNTANALTVYAPANFTVDAIQPDQVIVSGKNVKLNFTNSANIQTIQNDGTVNLVVVNTSNKDVFGRYLATATIAIEDGIAPELVATPVAVTDGDTVTVTFDEALDSTIAGAFKDGFTVSVNGTPKTIHDSTYVAKVISLNFDTTVFHNGDTVTVTPKIPSTVKDVEGNAYAPSNINDDTKTVTVSGFGTNITVGAVARVQGTAGSAATAPVWNSGAVTAIPNNTTQTYTFNGVTVQVTSGAVVTASAINGTAATVGVANTATAATTAQAVVDGLNAAKAQPGSPVASYTIAKTVADEIQITGTAAMGASNNALTSSGTVVVTNIAVSTPGVDAVAAATETASYQITHGADNTKTITVTLTNPAVGPVNVNVTAGMTAAQVAGAIKDALTTAGVLGFTVTAPSDTVIFTSTSANTNVADLTMTLGGL
ncbi:hypothetical protein JCM15765_25500 [Paradesulfitobacterium aromaticivorans]